MAERGPIRGTSLYLVLKSNGLPRPKIRLKKFGFSLKTVPANIAKKLPSQRCFKPLLIALFNFSHKRLTFAFTSESGYTLGFRRRIAHSGSHAETGAFPPPATVRLCAASEIFYSATLLYTYISRFSVTPHYISRGRKSGKAAAINFIPNRSSLRLSTSLTNGPHSLLRVKVSTPSASLKESHTRAHTAKQVAFWVGVVSLPSERFTRFGNPAWPGIRTANFAAFGSWPGVLQKNAESLRNSDALMRVAVPRRRGPAGLRDLFASW